MIASGPPLSPLQSNLSTSESFFAMLKEYRPAVLDGRDGLDGPVHSAHVPSATADGANDDAMSPDR